MTIVTLAQHLFLPLFTKEPLLSALFVNFDFFTISLAVLAVIVNIHLAAGAIALKIIIYIDSFILGALL